MLPGNSDPKAPAMGCGCGPDSLGALAESVIPASTPSGVERCCHDYFTLCVRLTTVAGHGIVVAPQQPCAAARRYQRAASVCQRLLAYSLSAVLCNDLSQDTAAQVVGRRQHWLIRIKHSTPY